MRWFLILAVAGLFATACGGNPTPGPGGSGYDHTATSADHQLTMQVGQKLEVVLHAGQGMNTWSHPESSDTTVLAPIVDPAATAAIGVTLAAFQAMKPGSVLVTSNASPKCPPNAMCPMYVEAYQLQVVVTR